MLRRFCSRTVILLYHRVASVRPDPWSLCVTPEHFSEHLDVLRKHRRIRLDQLKPGGWPFGGKLTVAITFDDGYADNLYEAQRLLQSHDTPATFFIATGCIDSNREFWWDELERLVFTSKNEARESIYSRLYEELQPLSHDVRRQTLDRMWDGAPESATCRPSHRTLTTAELRQLASANLFEIGAHTVTHPLLAAQPLDRQYAELEGSKKWLEAFLGRPVTSLSYPYGGRQHYTRATVEAARRAGFSRACTTAPRPVSRTDSPWEWGRFHVADMDGEQFQKFLCG